MEGNEKYIVRFRVEGQEAWREVLKKDTKLHYLGEESEYQRFDILETTFYYVEKSWLRMEQRGYRVEVSYVIFASKVSKLSKKF